jgi:hypothetical protein
MHKKNEPLIIPIIYCAKEKDEARDRRVSLNSWRVFCALSHVFEIMKSGLSSIDTRQSPLTWTVSHSISVTCLLAQQA